MALKGVGAKQFRLSASLKNRDELPTEVERVLHRNIHALAGLRAVGVAGVTRDEDPWEARSDLIRRDIIEPIRDALTDLVDREPHHVPYLKRIRAQHALSDLNDLLLSIKTEG